MLGGEWFSFLITIVRLGWYQVTPIPSDVFTSYTAAVVG